MRAQGGGGVRDEELAMYRGTRTAPEGVSFGACYTDGDLALALREAYTLMASDSTRGSLQDLATATGADAADLLVDIVLRKARKD